MGLSAFAGVVIFVVVIPINYVLSSAAAKVFEKTQAVCYVFLSITSLYLSHWPDTIAI